MSSEHFALEREILGVQMDTACIQRDAAVADRERARLLLGRAKELGYARRSGHSGAVEIPTPTNTAEGEEHRAASAEVSREAPSAVPPLCEHDVRGPCSQCGTAYPSLPLERRTRRRRVTVARDYLESSVANAFARDVTAKTHAGWAKLAVDAVFEVCDPTKLAISREEFERAKRAYHAKAKDHEALEAFVAALGIELEPLQ